MRLFLAGCMIIILLALVQPAQIFPQDARSFISQGESFAQRKMWDRAAEMFGRAIALQPQNPRAHNDLGFVYQSMGCFKEALQEYSIALKIKPDYGEARQNLLSGVCEWSQDLIDHGKYSTAIDILTEAVKQSPQAGELYYFLGIAYQAHGDFNDALVQWKKAAEIKPESSTGHYVKAIEALAAKNVPGAIEEFNKSIKVKPDNAYAHNTLGILLAQTGKVEEARREFEAAVKYKPNYVEAYMNLAFLAEKAGKMEEAISYYKQATIKNPYSYKGLAKMGSIYFKDGRFFDAESCFLRALRVHPMSSDVHASLAFTYSRQNKNAQAVQEFETALQLNPDNIDALYALGLIYKASSDPQQVQRAAELFQKCITVNPNHQYSQMAAQKLAEMGNPSPVSTGTPPATEPAKVQCESPDGDLAMSLSPKWQELPLEGEGSDKFLWIMAQPDKGLSITVYKPQKVPVNNLSMIKGYAIKDAEKKGCKKEGETPFTLGGQEAVRVQFSDGQGNARYLYMTVKSNKAYVVIGDLKDSALLPEIEEIVNTVQIK